MYECSPSCRCWPRRGEPFTPCEQAFLRYAHRDDVTTVDVMARMDDMACRVGADRVGYLLSVPVAHSMGIGATTPWVRLGRFYTTESVAECLTLKMLAFGACTQRASQFLQKQWDGEWKGWTGESSEHPGWCDSVWGLRDPVSLAHAEHRYTCEQLIERSRASRAAQCKWWDHRPGRRLWVRATSEQHQHVGDGCRCVPILVPVLGPCV